MEVGGGKISVFVGKGGRREGEGRTYLEMDVWMTYGSYEVDFWRGVRVGGGNLDVEFPETGWVGGCRLVFLGLGL